MSLVNVRLPPAGGGTARSKRGDRLVVTQHEKPSRDSLRHFAKAKMLQGLGFRV